MHQLLNMMLLATTAKALYFSLSSLIANDDFYPTENHTISFTVSNPDSPWEIGGASDQAANCCISWSACPAEAPTCWVHCSDSSYLTRITPGSYRGAWDFSIDIWQMFVFELADHNNATVRLVSGDGEPAWECEGNGDADGTVCVVSDGGAVNQTLEQTLGIGMPQDAGICGEA